MKTRRAILWPLIMLAAFTVFGYVHVALADGATAANAAVLPVQLPPGWAGLALVALVGASWAVRKFNKSIAFFHTSTGAAVMGAFTAVVPMVIQALEQHGLDVKTLETAVWGGLLSYWASDNASNTSSEQQQKIAAMRAANGASTPSPPPPPITKVGALLPLLFTALALHGCVHLTPEERAYGAAYGACMEAKGLAAAPGVGAEVWQDLSHGTNTATIVAQLEALAAKMGTDAVTCATQSWLAPPANGVHAEKNPTGVAAGNTYLKTHGS